MLIKAKKKMGQKKKLNMPAQERKQITIGADCVFIERSFIVGMEKHGREKDSAPLQLHSSRLRPGFQKLVYCLFF